MEIDKVKIAIYCRPGLEKSAGWADYLRNYKGGINYFFGSKNTNTPFWPGIKSWLYDLTPTPLYNITHPGAYGQGIAKNIIKKTVQPAIRQATGQISKTFLGVNASGKPNTLPSALAKGITTGASQIKSQLLPYFFSGMVGLPIMSALAQRFLIPPRRQAIPQYRPQLTNQGISRYYTRQ